MPGEALGALLERLTNASLGVRRVAAMDLRQLAEATPDARAVIVRASIDRVGQEPDEKTAIALVRLIARHAREVGLASDGAGVLLAMYDEPATPVGAAVEAARAAGELGGEEAGRRSDEEAE